jgi:arginine utilization protein RocB
MTSEIAARARELAYLLTGWPSVTGSRGEAALPHLLAERLAHFDRAWVAAIPGDAFGRSNVLALKKGRSKRTIVLTGHFDTVRFDDYGALEDVALQPDRLLAALLRKLDGAQALALEDFRSGHFLPGRGLLDMKAGLAAGIAAMEYHRGDATLLFLGVADEEERSAGARAAVPLLRALAEEEGLQIALIINLDSISDQGDGAKGRVVAYGSIGKQLLCAHVVGRPAHAGYPQDGVNAAYVMAELVRAIELAPELSEATGGEVAAAPSTLYAKDDKQGYDVTTPNAAFAYWNTMQHRRSGAEVLDIAMGLAARAAAEVERRTGHRVSLYRAGDLKKTGAAGDPVLPLPDQSRLAFTRLVKANGIQGPAITLGFGSIPYPAVQLKDQVLRKAIAEAVSPFGVGGVSYFAGISDVSFYGEAAGDLAAVAANTPIWGTGFVMPEPGGWPAVNIGPWGRDYHTPLERLHAPYAFETLPRILLSAIDAVAKPG